MPTCKYTGILRIHGSPFTICTQAGKAEKIALSTHAALNTAAMPVRQYLEATVVPILMQGLGQIVRERPSDPVEYLAAYLLKHNPQHQQAAANPQAPKAS